MKYRKFGKLDWDVSVLGFGAMRLPLVGSDPMNVNEPEAIEMIYYAIDHGVNYVDTAYPYHGGRSESIVGMALKDGYRKKVKLATKLPCWLVQSPGDFDRYLDQQLERLKVDGIDFYLLHGLNKDRWNSLLGLGLLPRAEGAISDGRIGHLGFSFHDDLAAFKEIVDGYDNWTLCQIQYNYMDIDYQAGTRGLKYAADKGLAVVVMEPLRGGRLTKKTPEPIAEFWSSASQKRTSAEWGLLWVWNHPEVSVALSGMSTMEQVIDNVSIAERSAIGILSADDMLLIDSVRKAYKKLIPIPCTNCRYCMPCPSGVEIPEIIELYNDAIMYHTSDNARFRYAAPIAGLKPEQRADRCIECGECLEACPQKIPIPEWLKKAHELLGPKK